MTDAGAAVVDADTTDARRLSGAALVDALVRGRTTTLERVTDLDDDGWRVPMRSGVNPIAWELGHLAWFAEFWILRGPHRWDATSGLVDAARPPRIAGSDALYDSARLAHAARWRHDWPSRAAILATLERQLDACLAALPPGDDDAALYFHRLALFHEDMHGEAFAWLRAALALPPPPGVELRAVARRASHAFAAGVAGIGRPRDERGFAFDNEGPAVSTRLDAFEIDTAPIDNAAFRRFVEDGGYENAAWWPGEAGRWRSTARARHPSRWRPTRDGGWEERWFDRWRALDGARPVVHVNAFEAEAYARWAGRRLPRAAEWERAAQSGAIDWGASVWEWTADAFRPYPGFEPGPYRDYSLPWMGGDHRELRGGSFATAKRLHDARYRNFFAPDRHDVFAGFRTATS